MYMYERQWNKPSLVAEEGFLLAVVQVSFLFGKTEGRIPGCCLDA